MLYITCQGKLKYKGGEKMSKKNGGFEFKLWYIIPVAAADYAFTLWKEKRKEKREKEIKKEEVSEMVDYVLKEIERRENKKGRK